MPLTIKLDESEYPKDEFDDYLKEEEISQFIKIELLSRVNMFG